MKLGSLTTLSSFNFPLLYSSHRLIYLKPSLLEHYSSEILNSSTPVSVHRLLPIQLSHSLTLTILALHFPIPVVLTSSVIKQLSFYGLAFYHSHANILKSSCISSLEHFQSTHNPKLFRLLEKNLIKVDLGTTNNNSRFSTQSGSQ